MLTPRTVLCCSVLWLLSFGCAGSSATMRKDAPVADSGGPAGYGYTPENPIKVGGGPDGEHEYLQHLRGPEGQRLSYNRRGSCCGFEDPSLSFGGGLLDMYEVTYEGLEKPVKLFLDMYRREAPRAPSGFRLD